jgi:hypothetical protein
MLQSENLPDSQVAAHWLCKEDRLCKVNQPAYAPEQLE